SVPLVVAFGGLRVAGDLAARGVKNHAMGVRDDGDDPVTLAQTGCPCARGQGSDHDCVALVVPGSAGFEAQFDLVGLRTFDLTGPVKRREARRGCKCAKLVVSPKGLPGRGVPERDYETDLYSTRKTGGPRFRIAMLLGYDWSEDHPQSQSLCFGQFFGLMNNPGYQEKLPSKPLVERFSRKFCLL